MDLRDPQRCHKITCLREASVIIDVRDPQIPGLIIGKRGSCPQHPAHVITRLQEEGHTSIRTRAVRWQGYPVSA